MKKVFGSFMLMTALAACPAWAGTLDNAPFKIVVPDKSWAVDDTTEKKFTQDVTLVAVLANADAGLKSVVMKTTLTDGSPTTVADYYKGAKETLTESPAINGFSEKNDVLADLRVRHFTYEITQNGQTTHNETVIFVSGKTGWAITCVGPTSQKDAIVKMLAFYQKKTP